MNPRKAGAKDRVLGRQLAEQRTGLRLTQALVAEAIGVSTQQYGKYERGETRVPAPRYNDIVIYLESTRGRSSGFGEERQSPFVAPLTRIAVQKHVDRMRQAMKDIEVAISAVQRYLDES